MATFREIRLSDWAQFVGVTDEALDAPDLSPFIRSSYLFRGQARSEWPLHPSLMRATSGLSAPEILRIEHGAYEAFLRHVYQHLDPATVGPARDPVTWWILMQHHSAPTRLLDWTASAYVAAYFAVVHEPEHDGAVWAVHARTVTDHFGLAPKDRPTIDQTFFVLVPPADPPLFVVGPLIETQRMSVQQTVFMVSPSVVADHGQTLERVPEPQGKALFLKLVVPAGLKVGFLRKLRRLNITAQALFPGVDGLGRSVTELVYVDANMRRRRP